MSAAAQELLVAISKRDTAKALALLNEKKVQSVCDVPDKHGATPLNFACAMGADEAVIARLVELGANVNKANKSGAVPLTHAVYAKCPVGVFERLVRAGANVNYQNSQGGTALQVACVCKAGLETVKKLVELGADPDLANHHGVTPIMFALRNHNDFDVVAFLAGISKNLDAQTKNDPKFPGYAALHFAAAEHNPAAAAILIKSGASLAVEDVEGLGPLMYADERTKLAMMSAYHAREHGLA